MIYCCDKFKETVQEDNLICILTNVPFLKDRKTDPMAYIQSDGGHGGHAKISFCPFCGNKLNLKETPNEN